MYCLSTSLADMMSPYALKIHEAGTFKNVLGPLGCKAEHTL